MAHLGGPKGKVVPELSLAPVAAASASCSAPTCRWRRTPTARTLAKVAAMAMATSAPLENVRFNPEETSGMPTNAPLTPRRSPPSARLFVSDGFGVVQPRSGLQLRRCRRSAARSRPAGREGGQGLSNATEPERPFTCAWRASKVSDKLLKNRSQGQRSGHRRWQGVHLPQGQGLRGRTPRLKRTSLRKGQGLHRDRREERR